MNALMRASMTSAWLWCLAVDRPHALDRDQACLYDQHAPPHSILIVCSHRLPGHGSTTAHMRDVPSQFAAQQNLTAQLRSAIKAHRDTWVSEADFVFLANKVGVNAVRLPVGYWALAQTQV